MSRTATRAPPVATARKRFAPPSRTTKQMATMTPHTTEGARRKDRSENTPMPHSDPTRSYRYASSGLSWAEAPADDLGRRRP